MIVRLTGTLESVDANSVVLALEPLGLAHELLVPTYLTRRLLAGCFPDGAPGGGLGSRVTFHTLQYLEAQGQGTSFIPRTLAFGTALERDFFELITSVKGLGNKRAARALAEEPGVIASAILERDLKALQRLPEIGKKLAETIVLELRDKVQPFAQGQATSGGSRAPLRSDMNGFLEAKPRLSREAEEAVVALIALGQSRALAEQMVDLALQRDPGLKSPDELVSAACAIRL